jgi:hypothetical protein
MLTYQLANKQQAHWWPEFRDEVSPHRHDHHDQDMFLISLPNQMPKCLHVVGLSGQHNHNISNKENFPLLTHLKEENQMEWFNKWPNSLTDANDYDDGCCVIISYYFMI